MWSWVSWFFFGVSINQMLYKKANNMSSWQDSELLNISFCEWDEWDSTEGGGGPWWEKRVTMCRSCYTDDDRGMVIISYGFECYHPQCTVFWFTSYIWVGSHILIVNWTVVPRKWTETHVFRTRVWLFGPHQSSNVLSHHPKPTRLSD